MKIPSLAEKLIDQYYADLDQARQSLVRHSEQVATLAVKVAQQIEEEVDIDFVDEAAWLHDIAIFLTDAPEIGCFGKRPYLMHGILGAGLLRHQGLPRHALVCERHIGVGLSREDILAQKLPLPLRDMQPQSIEEQIVAYADLFFSKHKTGKRQVEDVRKSLARFSPQKVAIFDNWHARFDPGVTG